jgi:hypothetical protein
MFIKNIGEMNFEFKTKKQSPEKRWKLLNKIFKKEEKLCKKVKSLIDKQGLNQEESLDILDKVKKVIIENHES